MIRFRTHDTETDTQSPLYVLDEAFTNPYNVRLTKRKMDGFEIYDARFKTDDGSPVHIMIDSREHTDDYDELMWRISFSRGGTQEVTGEGDAMRIFATVIKVTKDFLKKEDPKYIEMSAFKPNAHRGGSKDKASREKLYDRMVKRYMPSKYKVSSISTSTDTTWQFEKK